MRLSLESEDVYLIALYTNWHLRKAVKKDQVDAFVRRMAELNIPLQDKPKWYLDFYNVYWTPPANSTLAIVSLRSRRLVTKSNVL